MSITTTTITPARHQSIFQTLMNRYGVREASLSFSRADRTAFFRAHVAPPASEHDSTCKTASAGGPAILMLNESEVALRHPRDPAPLTRSTLEKITLLGQNEDPWMPGRPRVQGAAAGSAAAQPGRDDAGRPQMSKISSRLTSGGSPAWETGRTRWTPARGPSTVRRSHFQSYARSPRPCSEDGAF